MNGSCRLAVLNKISFPRFIIVFSETHYYIGHRSLWMFMLSLFIFVPCFNISNTFGVKAPLNDSGKDQKLTIYFLVDLNFSLTRGFDFVFLVVTAPLITTVMSIDEIGSLWGVGFDMLKSMKFWDLVDHISSSR